MKYTDLLQFEVQFFIYVLQFDTTLSKLDC
jgi:hypothetical protein